MQSFLLKCISPCNLQRKFEEDLDSKFKDVHKLENKVRAMSEELRKGNEIIKKLQGEIKNYHAKVKLYYVH